jgi:superoxide reductase
MTKMDVYKCGDGIVVEVMKGAANACTDLQCCGKPMELQTPNTVDAAQEKHVPVLEGNDDGVVVKVGSVPHPMTEAHSILWVEVINGDYVNRKYLNPGDAPEAAFYVNKQAGLVVRAYCNLHGLWEAKL